MSDLKECPKCGDSRLLEGLPRLYCGSCDWQEEDETAALRARVAVLEKVLRFYAHPMNWRVGGEFMPTSPDNDRRPDCGDTARQALATTEGE